MFVFLCLSFQRRTRAAFDIALRFHQNIQQRDIEVGRNLGNWILRWLDRWKPSAQIRPPSSGKPAAGASSSINMTKQVTNSQLKNSGSMPTSRNEDSGRHLFTSYKNMLPKPFPTIRMAIRPSMPTNSMTQYRHLSINEPETFRSKYARGRYGGVIRKDIMQWMLQN